MHGLVVALLTALLIASCDCFWEAHGTIVECGTTRPVVGANITVHVDSGFQGRMGAGVVTYHTDDVGSWRVTAGEPCESWVTLTFQGEGFDPVSTQFKGTPAGAVALCMNRTPPPSAASGSP
jgi:hypothetical protein